ncbi:MAG TPA: Lrp/AsnC family transcriptional regulator [Actinomycetota bacterium]|nr:Lrp/AsnC family transcriptional regulator [Actinomycetota bacterium]
MTLDTEATLDEIDRRILAELQEHGRITFTELGKRVALTAPAAAERVRRLEDAGVIAAFRAHLDPARVGYPITAFVRWTSNGPDCARLGDVAKEIPEIVECHRITGETSYILKVAARSVEHLESLLDRLIPHGSTITSVVLSSPVVHRALVPPERQEPAGARRPKSA